MELQCPEALQANEHGIQHSFELDERLSAPAVDRLIQQALESGAEETLTREKFDAARRRAREAFEGKYKAA